MRPSYLYTRNSYAGKTAFLYWNNPQMLAVSNYHSTGPVLALYDVLKLGHMIKTIDGLHRYSVVEKYWNAGSWWIIYQPFWSWNQNTARGLCTITADALAPCVARASAAVVSTMQDEWILVFHEKGYQPPAPSQCRENGKCKNILDQVW